MLHWCIHFSYRLLLEWFCLYTAQQAPAQTGKQQQPAKPAG
jgi:hypothetical protein